MVRAVDKNTSYNRIWERDYMAPICSFGEVVNCQASTKDRPNLQTSWSTGIWLGKSTSTGSHIIVSTDGVHSARTLRRRPPSRQIYPQRVSDANTWTYDFHGAQHIQDYAIPIAGTSQVQGAPFP